MAATAKKIEFGQTFTPYQAFSGDYLSVLDDLCQRELITFSEKEMLRILNKFAFKDGKCYPSQKRLESEIGLKNGQVRNLLRNLEEKGLIEIHRPNPLRRHIFRRHNEYFFLWHSAYSEYAEKTAKIQTDTEIDTQTNTQNDTELYIESPELRKSEKTAAERAAVVSSVNDDEKTLPKEILSLIHSDIPVTKGIIRVIKSHLAKSGRDLVERNIAYVNAVKLRDRNAYRAYLDKALREDYAIDHAEKQKMAEQAVIQAKEKAIQADQQAKREITDGLNTAQQRAERAQRAFQLPDEIKQSLTKRYLGSLNPKMRARECRKSIADLFLKSIGFKLFLESAVP